MRVSHEGYWQQSVRAEQIDKQFSKQNDFEIQTTGEFQFKNVVKKSEVFYFANARLVFHSR